LLAPLRYLLIKHPEKFKYDVLFPFIVALLVWAGYWIVNPKPALFGEEGLLRFARDLLVMAVPFMVGSLAAVAMGAPGPYLDKRPMGSDLRLEGRNLNMRQFICYLLGYLCFLGLLTLAAVVAAQLLHDTVKHWTEAFPITVLVTKLVGTLALSLMLSLLTVTVFWSLYFLTDVVNRPD
jgi:hypothetical protein